MTFITHGPVPGQDYQHLVTMTTLDEQFPEHLNWKFSEIKID
jgi:hypothetical protein